MTDEKTNETDTQGKETDKPVETTDKPVSPVEETKKNLEELKAANDEVEKELLRKEELKAKIAVGGQSDAGQAPETPKEISDKEYKDKVMKGEL